MALACIVSGAASAESPTSWAAPVTKSAVQSGDVDDAALWTPASGNAFVLWGCVFSTSAVGNVELEVSNVDVVPPIYLASSGTVVIGYGGFPLYRSAVDAVLRYTTVQSTAQISILCHGWEEPAGF